MSKSSQQKILADLAAGHISLFEASQQIQSLSEEKKITVKVGQKGGISFYGIRRMPITLYVQELESILGFVVGEYQYTPEMEEFLASNIDKLSRR
jgi:hypothetical protein